MSFVLSGGFNRSRSYEFRPMNFNHAYGIGNYIQSLRDLCFNSDGFVDASRVYDRFKIESGSIKITLYSFVKQDDVEMSYLTAACYGLIGAARYGKNLNANVSPNSVYDRSSWLFPSHIVQVDRSNRYMPYTESVTIPVKTGFTTFKKIFGNLYNVLITLALTVGGAAPDRASNYNLDFDLTLRLEWKFDCVGEGSAPSTLDWVSCMHFDFDRQQGVRVPVLTW